MKEKKLLYIILQASLLICLTGCSTLSVLDPSTVEVGQISSELPREDVSDVPADDLSELAAANREFALDLYQRLASSDGNLFCSPFSISSALAMTYAGAEGKTEEEMAVVL